MPRTRRKLSGACHDFHNELRQLERIDSENQFRLASNSVSVKQLHFLTEAVFFRAFRAYEKFVRDAFLLYCMEKRPQSGQKVTSYLKPKGFLHAEELIRSSMRHLDWTNPDAVMARAETYLKDGFPIHLPYSTSKAILLDFERIRNHIAHDSEESLAGYKKTLTQHYGAIPLVIPSPGEFLLVPDKKNRGKYKLQVFFELMRKISSDIA